MAVLLGCLYLSIFSPENLFAQTGQSLFSVSFRDKELASILDYISQHSDHRINYDNEVKAYTNKVTVSFDEVGAVKAVQELIARTPFSYNVQGKTIRVFRMTVTQTGSRKVTGVVKETSGMSIPNATIQLKGQKKGTVANLDGQFSLNVDAESGELIISAIGFETKTVKYTAGKSLRVVLPEAVNQLGEVAIIAYGERSKRELVGAISSVKGKELQDMPAPSIETLLQGKMAGVNISNLSGSPGAGGSQIVIRGYSSLNQEGINDGSPLFVVDGVPVQSTTSKNTGGINLLSTLDPATIESVDVLKDATSASLYGSRAANGVILVTTKKGKSGRPQFTASVSQSLSWLPKSPMQTVGNSERALHMMLSKWNKVASFDYGSVFPNSYEDVWGTNGSYDYFWGNGSVEESHSSAIVQDSLNSFYNNRTNWWDYVFRVGQVTKADVQASGGNDNVRYMVSAGVYNEKGIMINSSFLRASLLSNLDFKLTPHLNAFTRINLTYTDRSAGSDMGKVQGLTMDPKTSSSLLPGKGSIAEQEAVKMLLGTDTKNSNYNVRLSIGINWEILKGLKFSSTASLDHYMTHINTFYPDYLQYDSYSMAEAQNIGMTMLQTENLLTYKFNLQERHNFELMAGTAYNRDQLDIVGGWAKGGPTNQIHYVGDGWPGLMDDPEYGPTQMQAFKTDHQVQAMLSFFGRMAYNYRQKYLAEFSIRSDGSSVFGSNVRWAYFPSVGLGWAFSEEPFMKDLWWLSFGKIRGSWGRSGQKVQEAYMAHGMMATSNSFLGSVGLYPEMLSNNDLTWEKSDQYNIGIDLQMFNYRLRMNFDYYYKYSSALLMQTPVPGNFFQVSSVWSNSSAMSNEGLELQVEADILKGKPFDWTLGFNISRNWNMFRKAYGNTDLNNMVLGRPVYGLYTFHDEGIVQNESQIPYYYDEATGDRTPLNFGGIDRPLRVGGRKIKDQNGDGTIDANDTYYAGSTIPAAYGGISNHFAWKGFTLDILMNYMIGRKMMNMMKGASFNFTKLYGPVMGDVTNLDYWKKPGDQTEYPSLEFADSQYVGQFDGDIDSNIENVSFLRLKQLTLGYTFPQSWFKKVIKEFRVYVTGTNLFLLTNYSGVDPELVNPYTGKDTFDNYPLNREFTFGINLKF